MVLEDSESLGRAKIERRGHNQHQKMMLEMLHSVVGRPTISSTQENTDVLAQRMKFGIASPIAALV